MTKPVKISSAPGIKRDGTALEGDNYIDGQWCRFQRGRPRKINGYQSVTSTVPELTRGMTSLSANGLQFLHLGGAGSLGQYLVNNSGILSGFNDRTPATYSFDLNALWQFDHFFDAAAVFTEVVAHPGSNLADIDSTVNSSIFLGEVDAAGTLVDSTLPQVSGGIVTLGPFLFSFGNNGRIGWSVVNNPTSLDAEAFITQQKIVKGLPLRGAGQGPAGLFWSLDALIRATFVGGTVTWQFDTLASDISILSTQSVVEYDGVYYWLGVDRMLMFNGVVRDIPNAFNVNFFFDSLNFAQRQKVFAMKVPRFGEIWWCFPKGNSIECDHAIIFNVKEGYWFDTALPLAQVGSINGRTAGIYARVYNKPFMVDADDVGGGLVTLWQHETGADRIDGADIQPIPSHFETHEIGMPINTNQPDNATLRIERMENDFVQTADMTLTIKGRPNSKATVVSAAPITFPAVASTPTEETVKTKEIRRLMSFRWESNVQGGDYEFGECLAHIEPADGRIES